MRRPLQYCARAPTLFVRIAVRRVACARHRHHVERLRRPHFRKRGGAGSCSPSDGSRSGVVLTEPEHGPTHRSPRRDLGLRWVRSGTRHRAPGGRSGARWRRRRLAGAARGSSRDRGAAARSAVANACTVDHLCVAEPAARRARTRRTSGSTHRHRERERSSALAPRRHRRDTCGSATLGPRRDAAARRAGGAVLETAARLAESRHDRGASRRYARHRRDVSASLLA